MKKLRRVLAVFLAMFLIITGMDVTNVFAETEQEGKVGINYLVVEKPYLEVPDTQNIVVGLERAEELENISLYYSKGERKYSLTASQVTKEAVQFTIPYESEEEAGIYKLDFLRYSFQEKDYQIDFSELGMDIYYGVNQDVETSPNAEVVEDETTSEVEMNVVSFDENGEQISENSIEDVINSSESKNELGTDISLIGRSYQSDRTVVVVLDPGHDSTHGGTHSASGIQEADLTLKIAQYCYNELIQYQNVIVYMTRTTSSCPYPGTTSGEDNAQRVAFAKSVNADLYVSIHLNSASDTSVGGAEVYYPNTNYNTAANTIGNGVANSILEQLSALGLNNRGAKIKNSGDGTTYADGSLADYYGVIRNCKNNGITGIIVEHAFMSNPSEVANYLSSDAKLQALGIADATGIANYYDLTKSKTVYNGVDYALVYDPDYYYNNNPDVAKSCGHNSTKLLSHFVEYGMSEGRQAIASFDVKSYKNRYKDLRMLYGNSYIDYYHHYMYFGCAEGRIATGDVEITDGVTTYNGTDYSLVYDYEYYISNNSDVANAYPNDDVSALEHFVNYGMSEGRQAIASFNVKSYMKRYIDLRKAYMKDLKAYYYHYMNAGYCEGRAATGDVTISQGVTVLNGIDYSSVYDYYYYVQNNPDVAEFYPNDDISTLEHFVYNGMKEGRLANAGFDVVAYKNQNKDLRLAYGNALELYYYHYISYGKNEGRTAVGSRDIVDGITMLNGIDYSLVYDYSYYISHNKDIANAYPNDDISTLEHFVNYGMAEGRQATAEFNVNVYAQMNPDVQNAYGTDLKSYYLHYIQFGSKEGRIAN